MNNLKKIIGALCMVLAPVSAYLLTSGGLDKISKAAPTERTDAITQWSILILIFLPVMVGLFIFGWYAVKGEYSTEPQT